MPPASTSPGGIQISPIVANFSSIWQSEEKTQSLFSRIEEDSSKLTFNFFGDRSLNPDESTCQECFPLNHLPQIGVTEKFETGGCVTLSTSMTCTGYDPETCEFYTNMPHARAKECIPPPGIPGNNPGYQLRQCFYYKIETGQIYNEENNCLTLMAPDKFDYQDECDACETMAAGGYPHAGGFVYVYPCVSGGSIYQSWVLDKGLIKSSCSHGMYLADAAPFLIVADQDQYFGSYLLRFGDEHQITEKFPDSALESSTLVFGALFSNKLKNHGCWCSRLSKKDYIGGVPIDDLDEICKDWALTRRCLNEKQGSCYGKPTLDTFLLSLEKNSCPWTMPDTDDIPNLSCGQVENHLNSHGCQKDECLVDVKFLKIIANYFKEEGLELDTFSANVSSQSICHPSPPNLSGNNGTPLAYEFICEGAAPDVTLAKVFL